MTPFQLLEARGNHTSWLLGQLRAFTLASSLLSPARLHETQGRAGQGRLASPEPIQVSIYRQVSRLFFSLPFLISLSYIPSIQSTQTVSYSTYNKLVHTNSKRLLLNMSALQGLQKVKLIPNKNYKRSGTKSYGRPILFFSPQTVLEALQALALAPPSYAHTNSKQSTY